MADELAEVVSGLKAEPAPNSKGFLDRLKSNPLFGAAAGVAGMGVAFAIFRQGGLSVSPCKIE